MNDTCVCCGAPVPEGRQVCPKCEQKYDPYEFFSAERKNSTMNDSVNHPAHYTAGGVECIDAIRAAVVNKPPYEAWLTGQIIKYVWRYNFKNGLEDLKKAGFYLDRLIKEKEEK